MSGLTLASMSAAFATDIEPDFARARLQERFCLVDKWVWHSDLVQMNACEYLPRPPFVAALFEPASVVMMLWAWGLEFAAASAWVRDEGLRGLVQREDGAICMWSGGSPTLEYGSDDWHVLVSGTSAETQFPPPALRGSRRVALPPLEEILRTVSIHYGEEVVAFVAPAGEATC